jgi:hypothetical protein
MTAKPHPAGSLHRRLDLLALIETPSIAVEGGSNPFSEVDANAKNSNRRGDLDLGGGRGAA